MEFNEILIFENRFRVLAPVEMRIGDFQFSQQRVGTEGILVFNRLKVFYCVLVITAVERLDCVSHQLMFIFYGRMLFEQGAGREEKSHGDQNGRDKKKTVQ
jgi:hypothetical protein